MWVSWGKVDIKMPKTEKQKQSQKDYMKNFSLVPVKMPKDLHEQIKAAAVKAGKPMNTWLLDAIREKLERD